MANVISDETMEYVGILAKLELKDQEKESARQDMQKMLDYVADLKRNGEDLVNLAHQMKGEARGIGGTHFGEHFYALELAGREKNAEKIRSLLPEVLEEWERTIRGISGCLG